MIRLRYSEVTSKLGNNEIHSPGVIGNRHVNSLQPCRAMFSPRWSYSTRSLRLQLSRQLVQQFRALLRIRVSNLSGQELFSVRERFEWQVETFANLQQLVTVYRKLTLKTLMICRKIYCLFLLFFGEPFYSSHLKLVFVKGMAFCGWILCWLNQQEV